MIHQVITISETAPQNAKRSIHDEPMMNAEPFRVLCFKIDLALLQR